MMLAHNIFLDLGIAIIAATIVAYLVRLLKQPLIPAYVIAGILIGPFGFKLIEDYATIKILAEIGVAFLLFVVGLELELKKLKNIGLISSLGGTIQVFVLSSLGYAIAFALGFAFIESMYIAMMVSFSSTMVVVKLLSDKNELETLHGRILIGFLLMEDVFAILALSIITTIGNFTPLLLVFSLLKALGVLLFSIICAKYIFPVIFKFAAKSQELLLMVSITICFFFALGGYMLGFSIAIGAFIAGVALANLPYNLEIIGKMKPLRDFFSTLFFVSLGMDIMFNGISKIMLPLIVFLAFILLFKPIFNAVMCSLFGYRKRTSFMTAISLAQISEFGLIIVALGISLGHLPSDSLLPTMATMIAVITMTVTTYTIIYDQQIYHFLRNRLTFLDKLGSGNKEAEFSLEHKKHEIILIGHNRTGYSILNSAKKLDKNILVVDFNPDVIRHMIDQKVSCMYGDIGDEEILERINFKDAQAVISTVPDLADNKRLIRWIKMKSESTIIFVTANKVDEALELYNAGSDYVILPHFLGGNHISQMLEEKSFSIENMLDKKFEHIKELQSRKELGHEHPNHNPHHK